MLSTYEARSVASPAELMEIIEILLAPWGRPSRCSSSDCATIEVFFLEYFGKSSWSRRPVER